MPFGLTIGTERATALQVCINISCMVHCSFISQQSIQDELTRRNYSAEPGEFSGLKIPRL
jgi:hypothetical protein